MYIIAFLGALFLFTNQLEACAAKNQRTSVAQQQATSSPNLASVSVTVANHPQLGKILTDNKDMTLYMYTPDKNGQSTCYGQCAVEWPPLLATSGQPVLAPGIKGQLGTVARKDTTQQVTFNGMPLYYYIKDKQPGDVTGQDVEKKWYVINPDTGPVM